MMYDGDENTSHEKKRQQKKASRKLKEGKNIFNI